MSKILLPSEMIPLKKWYAFKGKLPLGSGNEHRIIIIYRQDEIVKYFYVTSKIDNVYKRAKYNKEAIADLDILDWDALSVKSCVQCDKKHLYECDEITLKNMYANGLLEYLGKIPEIVKTKIVRAICASKSFTENDKTKYSVDDY